VTSLLSEQSLQLLITETPGTFAAFAPLGLVLTIMLGAGVADRSGLFAALVRASLSAVRKRALVPAVMLTGMLTCLAAIPDTSFTCRWPASSSPARDSTRSSDS
jgi:aminobenzoyl-glutamate transport protein